MNVDVELDGGNTTQQLEGLYFRLKTRVETDGKSNERVLAESAVEQSISLAPDEHRSIPVEIELPLWTPITRAGTSVWLATGVEIDWARDPTDEDQIEVVPDEFVSALFDAVEELGFAFRSSHLVDISYVDDRPFAQKFTFRPIAEQYVETLDELEITVMPRANDLRVVVEFDRRGTVADEHGLDFDEQQIPITFDQASADAIRRRINAGIDHHG